jgi:hypothetical protein
MIFLLFSASSIAAAFSSSGNPSKNSYAFFSSCDNPDFSCSISLSNFSLFSLCFFSSEDSLPPSVFFSAFDLNSSPLNFCSGGGPCSAGFAAAPASVFLYRFYLVQFGLF